MLKSEQRRAVISDMALAGFWGWSISVISQGIRFHPVSLGTWLWEIKYVLGEAGNTQRLSL